LKPDLKMKDTPKKTLIKNGNIIAGSNIVSGDLLVTGEKISRIGGSITEPKAEVIDAKGGYVLPGGIDVHTHFNLDIGTAVSQDDFYTGTVAAAFGGTTTIVDHPGFGPEGCSLFHQIEKYHEFAKTKAVVDYSFHGVLQHVDGQVLKDIPKLADQGITSMKAYMTYDYMLSDQMLMDVFKVAKENKMIVAVHAEDDTLIRCLRKKYIDRGCTTPIYHAASRPVQAEAPAVKQILDIAYKAGDAPVYIVHLTTKEGLSLIEKAKQTKRDVIAETCPQYLLLDEECYNLPDYQGLKSVISAPLTKKEHCDALWQGLMNKSIDIVATDHCSFDFALKKRLASKDFSKCPQGCPGVEARIPLMFTKAVKERDMSIQQFVKITAENPARIMGLYPQKGVIAKGSDADIIILDTVQDPVFDSGKQIIIKNDQMHENVDYSPYEGFKISGWPTMTMVRGSVIVKEKKFFGKPGYGKFIKRKRYTKFNSGKSI